MSNKDYILIFNDFVEEVKKMTTGRRRRDQIVVIQSLPSLSIKLDKQMFLHVAKKSRLGDNSYFYIDKESQDENLYKYLYVESSENAAWEIYLLMSSSTFMPFFGHGGYNQRKYVLSNDQLNEIDELKGRDTSQITQLYDMTPVVVRLESGEPDEELFKVECFYWNNWNGLIRETVHVAIRNHEVTNYAFKGAFVVYQYDCGIYF